MTNRPVATAEPAPKVYGRLHQRLLDGDFAITAEVVPPRGATLSGIRRIARFQQCIDIDDRDGAEQSAVIGNGMLIEIGQ